MSLTYRPNRFASAVTKKIGETRDSEVKFGVLLDGLGELTAAMNLEFRRVADSMNGSGGRKARMRVVTVSGDVVSTDGTVFGDTTGGAVTMTLPYSADYPGMLVKAKKQTGGPAFRMAPRGTDTIDGAASSVVVTTGTEFHSTGTGDWLTF